MEFQNQTEFYGFHPCSYIEPYSTYNLENKEVPLTNLSEKAKAFTIDALLSTDQKVQEPEYERKVVPSCRLLNVQKTTTDRNVKDQYLAKPSTQEKYAPSMQQVHNINQENFFQNATKESYLPLKQEPAERTSCDYVNEKYFYRQEPKMYSPMMTGWFFRPNEVYSPLSSQGQSTPIGLKSVYPQSYNTPDFKNKFILHSNEYDTPTGKSNLSSSGGRKIMSTCKRHDRLHPYLSSRHQVEFESQNAQEIQNNKTPLKTGKGKRQRTAFTPHQLQVLEAEFEKQQYMVGDERISLAESLDLTVSQVKVWFQNRRIKWRKEQFEQGKSQV